MKFLAHSSKLLALSSILALGSFAQNPIDNAQLYLTDNQVTADAVLTIKAGGTLTTESGAAVDLSSATVTFADDQIAQVKVNGLVAALAAKQPLDDTLTNFAAVTFAANKGVYWTAADTAATYDLSSFGRTLSGLADYAALRTGAGLVIGTNVQAWDADLDTWATKTPYAGNVVVTTGKSITVTNTLTLTGTDGSTLAIGAGGTLGTAAYTATTAYATAAQGTLADNAVPSTRTLSTTAPLTIGGGSSADLSSNRTLAISAATTSAAGSVELATDAETVTGTDTVRAVTPAADKAALDARFNQWTRDTGYIWSDGVTQNRAQIQNPGPRGNIAGAAKLSWVGFVDFPATNPAGNVIIFGIGPNSTFNTAGLHTEAYNLWVMLGANGVIQIWSNAAAFNNRVVYSTTNFVGTYGGKRVWLDLRLTNNTGIPELWIDGVDVSASLVANNSGTPPTWIHSGLICSYFVTGFEWPAGPAPLGCWLNAHLTNAESEAWRKFGRVPFWVDKGGTQSMPLRTWANYPIPPAGYETFTGASKTGFTAVATDSYSTAQSDVYNELYVHTGETYIAEFTLTLNSGQAPFYYISDDGGSQITTPVQAVNGANSITTTIGAVAGASNERCSIMLYTTAAADFVISDFRLIRTGGLSLPLVQPILALDDTTLLGGNQAFLAGMWPVTSKRDWRLAATTSTNGNEQVLFGAPLDFTKNVIDSLSQKTIEGTPTTIVGSSSGASDYKASSALTAGPAVNVFTPVTKTISPNNGLWVGSNSTEPIRTVMTGHISN
ncbi:MAG TPA: hypothetical protein VK985_09595 [Rariglobus sp.]|nr:hypothetical protein [Rariglobus sp.]